MEITNWTQRVSRGTYAGPGTAVKYGKESSGTSSHNTDTLNISKEARQAAMAAEMDKDGISRGTAGESIPGKFTVKEPDWDTFEVQTLEGQADPKIYSSAYLEAYIKELGALTEDVQGHYRPENAKMEGMNTADAMQYLFKTYKMPWMKDVFIAGTAIPQPPNAMSRDEADMAYNQLKNLYEVNGIYTLRDPYALGAEGINRLDNIEKHAHGVAQGVYDAAQKEYETQQETWKAEQKERSKRMYQNLNNVQTTALGHMTLQSEGKDESAE